MLFNSYTFIVFFTVVLVVSRLNVAWRARKGFLLLASYLFYAAWNPPFVILLWFSTVVDWVIAKRLDRTAAANRTRRRWLLFGSLAANLGLLAYFKYGGFMLTNIVALGDLIGLELALAKPDIILPVGISFYTFQTLSYTFDVYRGKTRPWHSFLDYALYVTFFPQLVAGPIVRAVDFLPQCSKPRRANARQLNWGICLIIFGLFQKTVIADAMMAPIVESIFDSAAVPSFLAAWSGTLAFAAQIFCDFAGYSTTAIGVAMCIGFELPDNFRFPYAAVGFSDFWRRWHISLSTWLRDYLYISLGGNRKGAARTMLNAAITMLLGGLWHGASWRFVVWGGLHGVYLVAEQVIRAVVPARPLWQRRPVQFLLAMLTFTGVCFAWVFFRAQSFARAFDMIRSMVALPRDVPQLLAGRYVLALVGAVTAALIAAHWFMREKTLEQAAATCPALIRAVLLATMLVTALVSMSGEDRAFIYFQF